MTLLKGVWTVSIVVFWAWVAGSIIFQSHPEMVIIYRPIVLPSSGVFSGEDIIRLAREQGADRP
jgi:hypothetical protein